MKILLTIHNVAYKGGGERVVANLANALCQIPNYEVCILSYYTDEHNTSCPYPLDPRVKIAYLHNFNDFHEKEKGIRRILWRWTKTIIINLRLNKSYSNYDIIIESDYSMFYPRFKTKNTKYIKIMHMVINKWKQKNRFYDRIVFLNTRELERWRSYGKNIIKIPNFLPYLPFEDTLHNAIQYYNAITDKKCDTQSQNTNNNIKLLPYTDIKDFKESRNLLLQYKLTLQDSMDRINNATKHKKIIAVGRMEAKANHKGFPRLIQAYSKIAQEFPEWQLHIIGDDQQYIILRNFTYDIEKEYLESDIFAMSSHSESLPMVLLEAASYGLPLIAYDIITIRDCFENNGILVPDNDEIAFCNAFRTLMSDEQKRLEMGQNGIKLVSKRFSKNVVMQQWIAVFDELHNHS